MYQSVLIPLDGSEEAEGVFGAIEAELAPDCAVILLQVVPPGVGKAMQDQMSYLNGVIERAEGDRSRWRSEITMAETVSQGIADAAMRNNVDLIAMYTHDRKGLAKLIRGSIAANVERKAQTEVRVLKPPELAGAVT